MSNLDLKYRRANVEDLVDIVALLINDELGKNRERLTPELDSRYLDAFNRINNDQNQYLMVVELDNITIGTCHATSIPSLTFTGSTRLQIEAVRINKDYRGRGIGEAMISEVIRHGKNSGASIIQLTTNKQRPDALLFYEKLGFEASHEGMKLYLD